MSLLYYFLLFVLSVVLVKCYVKVALKKGLLDIPNARSSHVIPTPRGGGLVFIGLWLVILIIAVFVHVIPLALCCYFAIPVFIIASISFLDDNINLPARWRFLAQLLAVILTFVMLGMNLDINLDVFNLTWPWVNLTLLVIFSLWSINLFNFMDGTDGLAAVQALFILSMGGLLLYLHSAAALSIVLWSLASLLLGFLVWNWPKAKVFMGDVGSATLGLIVALSGIYAQKYYQLPFILWLMLYAPFLFDATLTLIRRLLHKEKWYQAHRLHAYQRLIRSGWSHKQLLLAFIVLNVIISALVLLTYFMPQLALVTALSELIMLCIIYAIIEKRLPMYPKHADL